MNTSELQQLKMAWLAAEEAGDKQTQVALLRDHPGVQDVLIDFIAAYHVTAPVEETTVLPLTRRAYATALERVFGDARAEPGAGGTWIAAGCGCVEKV